MAQDVWEAARGEGGGEAGDQGAGIGANRAFAADTVFRLGWALLREQPAVFLTGGLALVVLQFGGQVIQQIVSSVASVAGDALWAMAASVLVSVIVGIGSFVGLIWVSVGTQRAAVAVARGEVVSPLAVFGPPGRTTAALLGNLGTQLAILVPALVVLSPGLAGVGYGVWALDAGESSSVGVAAIVAGALWAISFTLICGWFSLFANLVTPAIACSDLGVFDAMGAAWDAARGARTTLFVLALAFVVGQLFACCFGGIGLIPFHGVYLGGLGLGWALYDRPRSETAQWPFLRTHAPDLVADA
jgi:hypothetical protein